MSVSVKPLVEAMFGVKSLKKWNTDDGGGYQFVLTFEGKPVATVTNEGHGGPTDVRWTGMRWDGSLMPGLSPADTKKAEVAQRAKTSFDAIVKAAPPFESYGMMLTVNDEILLDELLNYMDLQKVCKSKTAFRLPEDPDSYHVLKAPFDSKVRAYVLGKWPSAIILNENPFA